MKMIAQIIYLLLCENYYLHGYCYILKLDFHSFLSNSSAQEATTVCYHLEQLIEELKKQDKLLPGKTLLYITDGCTKQYCLEISLFYVNVGGKI